MATLQGPHVLPSQHSATCGISLPLLPRSLSLRARPWGRHQGRTGPTPVCCLLPSWGQTAKLLTEGRVIFHCMCACSTACAAPGGGNAAACTKCGVCAALLTVQKSANAQFPVQRTAPETLQRLQLQKLECRVLEGLRAANHTSSSERVMMIQAVRSGVTPGCPLLTATSWPCALHGWIAEHHLERKALGHCVAAGGSCASLTRASSYSNTCVNADH